MRKSIPYLAAFASAAAGVDIHFRWRPQLKDSDDGQKVSDLFAAMRQKVSDLFAATPIDKR